MASNGKTVTDWIAIILFIVGLAMGIATIVLTYVGIPGSYDAEPILGAGLLCLALGGLLVLIRK